MNWNKKELEDGNVEIYYFNNEEKPLVSVITTCKKDEPDLEKLKEALLNQTFKDFELVVTHDKRIAEGYNKGVSYARGKILCFTETDCVPREDWLEEMVEEMEKNGRGKIIFGATSKSYLNLSSVAIHKEDFVKFNEDFLIDEDTEWFSHLKANGKELVLTNNKGIVLHNRTRRTYRNQLKIAFMEAYYCPRIHKIYGKGSIVSPWIFLLSYCFQSLVLFMRFLGLFAGIVRWRVIGFYGHKKKFE